MKRRIAGFLRVRGWLVLPLIIPMFASAPAPSVAGPRPGAAEGPAIIIDHSSAKLDKIPKEWIDKAKATLHIAYGHTSHGSQLTTGMAGLVKSKGSLYAWKNGGGGGGLDLRDYYGDFGRLGIAGDLGADAAGKLDRAAWEKATRAYLKTNPGVNVVIWSWCWQIEAKEAEIQLYLDLMSQLESDYPQVTFVYMTGHADGSPVKGQPWEIVTFLRNNQIRDFCRKNGKVLYDFNDIECYDPDGNDFGDKLVNDACDYDSDGDGKRDRNWAVDWQNAHPGEWYNCESAHSQPLNANLKAYAAWALWARLAGWDGQ
jgi:hypothetical protein